MIKKVNKLVNDPPEATPRPATEFAASWQQTESLDALREAIGVGSRLHGVVSRSAGLSESEMTALEHLAEAPAGPAALAEVLEVSAAAVTGIVDKLAGHGHLERRPHPTDRRRTVLELTPSGREEVLAHLMPMFRRLRTLDEGFTANERAVVARYLRGATEAFEEIAGRRPSGRPRRVADPGTEKA